MEIRLNMSPKDINEGYRAGIPENIMSKMIQGMELTENEKDFVRSKGKVYVLGHTKYRGQTRIKPQLRDLPGGRKSRLTSPSEIDWLKKYYVVEGKSFYAGAVYEPLAYFTTEEEAIREKNKLMNIHPTDLRKGLRTRYRHRKLVSRDAQILEWMEQERG